MNKTHFLLPKGRNSVYDAESDCRWLEAAQGEKG